MHACVSVGAWVSVLRVCVCVRVDVGRALVMSFSVLLSWSFGEQILLVSPKWVHLVGSISQSPRGASKTLLFEWLLRGLYSRRVSHEPIK